MTQLSEARPLLIIPVLGVREPLVNLLESVQGQARVLVIDNSAGAINWDDRPEQRALIDHLTQPYTNLGCGASWNAGIRQSVDEPYWLVANADTVLAPGAIRYVVEELEKGGPRWVGIDGDWRLMGLSPDFIEQVGWFDESFHPIYAEDCDMEYRATLAGVPWYHHQPTGSTHAGGASWKTEKLPGHEKGQANRAYYVEKWGGMVRGGERYSTPFNSGQPDKCGPSIQRLRAQQWKG